MSKARWKPDFGGSAGVADAEAPVGFELGASEFWASAAACAGSAGWAGIETCSQAEAGGDLCAGSKGRSGLGVNG
jgi:hypothetical protein